MKVRIQFSKHGAMKFLGHLDIMRYFQKAIRRAGIDIAYTGGFSPHPVMSFASPLGVGLESDGEYMEIEVRSHGSADAMKEALNAEMAEGIRILSVKALPERSKNVMASVAAAGYRIRFREGLEPDFLCHEAVARFLEQETIPYEKQTKKNTAVIDLRAGIYECSMQGDEIYLLTDAGSAGNIKPDMVMEAFYRENGRELPRSALQITRTQIYENTGTQEQKIFRPLSSAGEEF